ncbi:MAG: acyltransferase [Proteobacteria bacterium]|nr:acyltransferase [Pseudomonadota bacterium]
MDAAKPRSLAKGHIPALDGIRGFAIIMVMMTHFFGKAPASNFIERMVGIFSGYGTISIDLFFVLSGFLITGILLDTKAKPNFFKNFYIRRTLRIFPLYYAVLTVIFLILPLIPWFQGPILNRMGEGQLWAWLYLYNFYIASIGSWTVVPYISHFWSLAVEEQFYLVWPLCAYYMSITSFKKLNLYLIVFASLLHLYLEIQGVNPIVIHVMTLTRLSALCIGGLIAILLREESAISGGKVWAQKLAWKVFLAAVLGKFLIVLVNKLYPALHSPLEALRTLTWLGVFAALHLAAVSASNQSLLIRAFNLRVFLHLGKYSYGIYVFHHFIMGAFHQYDTANWLFTYVPDHFYVEMMIGTVGMLASVLVAQASFHGFEKPFLSLKDVWASKDA